MARPSSVLTSADVAVSHFDWLAVSIATSLLLRSIQIEMCSFFEKALGSSSR